MNYPRLLAKSVQPGQKPGESHTLPGHLKDAHAAACALLDATARDQLRAMGIDGAVWESRMRRIVEVAAACHDLGKANDHFLDMLAQATPRKSQGVRHEWVSVWLLTQPAWQVWLAKAFDLPDDFDFVLWAIAGHHPAPDRASPPQVKPENSLDVFTVLAGHIDFRACCEWLAFTFNLGEIPPLADLQQLLKTGPENFFKHLSRWQMSAVERWRRLSPDERRLVAVVKACLIGADVAGSALPQTPLPPERRWCWIGEAFQAVPRPAELQEIVKSRLGGHQPREFQRLGAASEARVTFVRAGCGSGKTLLAYMWAQQQCPNQRLYVCYPTTGTATEGYRDYLVDEKDHGRFGADLFHSRASVDLDIFGVKDDEDDDFLRIDSLRAWSTPIVCCTVDTVLGLMQNQRRGLYSWPALAGAAFVFDEIHSYDSRLWEALIRLLKDLRGVRVLLMTASLPTHRLEALRRVLGNELNEIPGPVELESLPRYHRSADTDLVRLAREEVACGGKVLWVCNTVRRAMQYADQLGDLAPPVYHSRFRYEDRVARHREVIDSFKPENPAAIAFCTQVAEMSLDLSASLLITDLAPISALIQRLGRLNRRARLPGAQTMPFLIVEPEGHLPYSEADLVQARLWLAALGSGAISQADLTRCWDALVGSDEDDQRGCCWLDGGPQTQVSATREESHGITVLLQADRPRMRTGNDLVRLALPMPPPPAAKRWKNWPRWRGLPIVPAAEIAYDPKRGGEW